ncbi:MAG: TAXI family TRAP transporter solute-binding subunit [Kiloniellaceae bacterium]
MMSGGISRRQLLGSAAVVTAAGVLGLPNISQAALPDTMLWTAADIGSSGYAEASAIANALINRHGTRIRIVPSGTSIGRMLQLRTGRVQLAFLANEAYFGSEAIFDFSSREWGPQNLRALMGRPALFGIVTAKDAGIKTLADLRGRRVSRIKAHPSTNFKVEAVMAFAGLTWDDVEPVEMPSYGAGIRAVIDGDVDAAGAVVGASLLRELEASPRGIHWPPVPADDAAGWEQMNAYAPLFKPAVLSDGPGATPDAPVPLVAYRYPILSVYAEADEQMVYDATKAVVEAFDDYKDANKVMPNWSVDSAGHPPFDTPVHPGAIRYYKEAGLWTEADQAWNDKRMARLEQVQKAWDEATALADEQQLPDKKWDAFWSDYRAKNL